MAGRLYSRRWVALGGGLVLAFLLPLFGWLAWWQWDKGQSKLARQADLEGRSAAVAVAMPRQPATADTLRHRRFILRGEYDASRQVLIDNRLHQGRAGYHVITPLRLSGSDQAVLVNRGWVPAPPDHRQIPEVPPPRGAVEISGLAVVPGNRFFTLGAEDPAVPAAAPVWQNLDLERFRSFTGYLLQPVVIQLDPAIPGGYGRDWPRPDEGAERNLGYAVQWLGFAVASIGIWLFFLLRRP